jgi:hypothetical protein
LESQGYEIALIPPTLNSKPTSSDAEQHRVYKKGREFCESGVPLHWANNPVQTVEFKFQLPPTTELYNYCKSSYLNKFNQTNIQARGFDTRAELERTYRHLIIPIPNHKQEATSSTLSKTLQTKLTPDKLEIIKPWIARASIAQGAKWLEAGMPHTHDNTMIMNAGWFDRISCETYIHELIHIIQRHRPELFTMLYTSPAWNYKYVGLDNLIGLDTPLQLARMNPDATDFGWIWTEPITSKHYWINAIFTSSTPSALTDVKYLAYHLIQQPGNKFRYIGTQPTELKELSSFVNSFGIGYNHYHPNEIASQYAEYYFCQCPQELTNKPAYCEFASWINKL